MAINVNSLPEYIEVNKDELFVKSVAGAKTLDYVEIMANVKGKAALNYLDSSVVLADGSSCGWNPQGDDTFTQKYVDTKLITVQKEFCWKDMRNKWMNYDLNIAAGRETLPFEAKIAESNTNAIKKEVEKMVWQGNDNAGVDGFLAQMTADSAVVKGEGGTAAERIEKAVELISTEALEKGVTIFVSFTDFRSYVKEKNAEYCNYRAIIDANTAELIYAGDSRIKIVPVAGLEGTSKVVAATADALVYATDIEGADNVYRLWYDDKTDMLNFKIIFNCGLALKFSNEIVLVSAM